MSEPMLRPDAIEALNAFADALSGGPQIRAMEAELAMHRTMAAAAVEKLHGGADFHWRVREVESILRQIAGMPFLKPGDPWPS